MHGETVIIQTNLFLVVSYVTKDVNRCHFSAPHNRCAVCVWRGEGARRARHCLFLPAHGRCHKKRLMLPAAIPLERTRGDEFMNHSVDVAGGGCEAIFLFFSRVSLFYESRCSLYLFRISVFHGDEGGTDYMHSTTCLFYINRTRYANCMRERPSVSYNDFFKFFFHEAPYKICSLYSTAGKDL